MKRSTIIDNSNSSKCWACNGVKFDDLGEPCVCCDGTGKWKETHYIIVDEKNKIAIDSDNIG